MDWLRWHHGTVADPKWRVVAAESGATVGDVVAVWACMVEHASEASPRGTLSGWRDKVYAMLLGNKPETVSAIREAMQGLVLEGESLSGWEKRQPKYDPTAADRKRRQRERANDPSVDCLEGVTLMSRNVTTDKSRVEQKKETTGASFDAGYPIGTRRGRQLPADWQPNAAHREQAEALGVDLEAELAQFRDHHTAKGTVMKDWEAAFRTWLRNARRFQRFPVVEGTSAIALDPGVWG